VLIHLSATGLPGEGVSAPAWPGAAAARTCSLRVSSSPPARFAEGDPAESGHPLPPNWERMRPIAISSPRSGRAPRLPRHTLGSGVVPGGLQPWWCHRFTAHPPSPCRDERVVSSTSASRGRASTTAPAADPLRRVDLKVLFRTPWPWPPGVACWPDPAPGADPGDVARRGGVRGRDPLCSSTASTACGAWPSPPLSPHRRGEPE